MILRSKRFHVVKVKLGLTTDQFQPGIFIEFREQLFNQRRLDSVVSRDRNEEFTLGSECHLVHCFLHPSILIEGHDLDSWVSKLLNYGFEIIR